MDPAIVTAAFLGGATAGSLLVAMVARAKHAWLLSIIADRNAQIGRLLDDQRSSFEEAAALGKRCSELRIACRDKDQANDKLLRRIAELEAPARITAPKKPARKAAA